MTSEKYNRPKKRAPSVAEKNRDVAKRNIEAKLKLLQFGLGLCTAEDASVAFKTIGELRPQDIFPTIPCSFRAFNDWDSKSLSSGLFSAVGNFEKNGHRTLQSHKNLYESASVALRLARARNRTLQDKPTKLESLAGARRRSSDAAVMRDIAIRELEDLRIEFTEFKRKSKNEINRLSNEVRELKQKNSELMRKIEIAEWDSSNHKVRRLPSIPRRPQNPGP